MARILVAIATLAACAEPTGLGEASSTAHPSAASATVIVANGTNGIAAFRVWSIEIGENAPGTDCKNRGDALVVLEVYTQLSSAPRGTILLTTEVPPFVFPKFTANYPDGFAIDGTMIIDAASTTGLFGSYSGQANLAGSVVRVDVEFDAPTCSI
ncbi:MAG: hypothetical protein ACKV2T_29485 [Kofleriaceae bacterium]